MKPRNLTAFLRDDSGGETLEYAILVGLVASALLALVLWVGGWVARRMNQLKGGTQ